MSNDNNEHTYTVSQLANMIRRQSAEAEKGESVSIEIPSRVRVIDGTVSLTEGADIGFYNKKGKSNE